MRTFAHRTARHAMEDLGVTAAKPRQRPSLKALRPGVRKLAATLPRHPVRRLFGESRSVRWLAIMLILLVGMLLVRPMMRSAFSYHRTAGLLEDRRAEVAELDALNRELHAKRDYRLTDAFIAERAREYALVRPGEQAFVIRELARPEAYGRYADARFRNATFDAPNTSG